MEIVSVEEIVDVQEQFTALTEPGIRKLMKSFQKAQTALLVYTAAVAEREQLNEEEYDLLISATLLLWQAMKNKFPGLKKVGVERVEELDNSMFQDLEARSQDSDAALEEYATEFVASYAQPNLLGILTEMTVGAEPAVRQDLRIIIFLTVKNVLDALIEAAA